jgi:Domain of unknown function (DUF1735)
MKKINSIIALIALGSFTFTSCLKDKGFDKGTYGIDGADKGKVAELPAGGVELTAIALDFVPGIINVDLVNVNIAADQPVSSDVTVTLVANNALIADYNNNHGSTLEPLPPAAFTIDSYVITIPRGSRNAYLKLKLNAAALDLSKAYALGFSIASVSGDPSIVISQTFRDALFNIGVKNKYDGKYSFRFKGVVVNNDRPTFDNGTPATYPAQVYLITSGPNTVDFFNTAFNAGFHPLLLATGSFSALGSTAPRLGFDLATNNMTSFINAFPNPANGRQFTLNGAVTGSKWDAATKRVTGAATMTQPGFGPINFFDTLNYVGPR